MYDSGKIIVGILIFLLLMTLPFVYNLASGQGAYKPDPVKPKDMDKCILDTDYMTSYHMDLLDEWRDEVVREGDRFFVAMDKKTYEKSLTNTCLKCHSNKSQFCDKCHDYLAIDPYCWECHVVPKEEK